MATIYIDTQPRSHDATISVATITDPWEPVVMYVGCEEVRMTEREAASLAARLLAQTALGVE